MIFVMPEKFIRDFFEFIKGFIALLMSSPPNPLPKDRGA